MTPTPPSPLPPRLRMLTPALAPPVPAAVQVALQRYFERGLDPGGFVRAVLENDLVQAVLRHDGETDLVELVRWLWQAAPSDAWGSPAQVDAWSERGGVRGTRHR